MFLVLFMTHAWPIITNVQYLQISNWSRPLASWAPKYVISHNSGKRLQPTCTPTPSLRAGMTNEGESRTEAFLRK